MTESTPVQNNSLSELAVHLSGIHKALLSVARVMDADDVNRDDTERTIQSQLEWAASHLHEAIRELKGSGDFPASIQKTAFVRNGHPITVGGVMEGLKGHSQAIAIPEILGFVSSLRKSGLLRINSSNESFLVQLEDGALVYAQGDNPPEGGLLGDILVSQGALNREELEETLPGQDDCEDILGRMLLDGGIITKDQLCIALAFQVQSLFHRMYVAQNAIFQFDEGVKLMEGQDIRLNVTSLLLDSARNTDEDMREPETEAPAA